MKFTQFRTWLSSWGPPGEIGNWDCWKNSYPGLCVLKVPFYGLGCAVRKQHLAGLCFHYFQPQLNGMLTDCLNDLNHILTFCVEMFLLLQFRPQYPCLGLYGRRFRVGSLGHPPCDWVVFQNTELRLLVWAPWSPKDCENRFSRDTRGSILVFRFWVRFNTQTEINVSLPTWGCVIKLWLNVSNFLER